MAYIYKITNDINDKVYIGKTLKSIQKRWSEHQSEARSDRSENRPLYKAIKKYGVEHFKIELIEETDNPEEREIYWIKEFNSFHNGYNATLGGDGKPYIDRDLVVATYNELHNGAEVAKKLNICRDSVYTILSQEGIQMIDSHDVNAMKFGKPVEQFSKDEELIESYPSIMEAARKIVLTGISKDTVDGVHAHISQVCNGRRKAAYGFIWKFSE